MKKILICLLLSTMVLSGCSGTKDTEDSTTSVDSSNTSEEKATEKKASEGKEQSIDDVSKKVKDYINSGQGDKPEATKLNWNTTFLDKVDFKSLAKKYKSDGGNINDTEKFAEYITKNAPILTNWEELFKQDLKNTYDQDVVRLEKLEDDSYQAYANIEGKEVPFVVVNARTGYYHG